MKRIHKFIIGGIIVTALLKIPYLKYQQFDLAGLLGLIIMGSFVGWIAYGVGELFRKKNKPKNIDNTNNDNPDKAQTESLLQIVDAIDKTLMEATGSVASLFKNDHDSISALINESAAILKLIQDDFSKNQIDAVHIFWYINLTRVHLTYLDSVILVEIRHSGDHKEGFDNILTLINLAHESISEGEEFGKEFLASRNKKIRDLTPRIVEYLNEYHKTLFMIKRSVENAIKFGTENKTNK